MFTLYLLTRKGFEVLKALLAKDYGRHIDLVVVGADKNTRGDYGDEIRALCDQHRIAWGHREERRPSNSPFSLAVSWRWLINEPATTLIVLHDSLLPKYRGFAPLISALVNGDREIGVTALYATGEYDRGDIIFSSSTAITYPIRIGDAIENICKNYVSVALSIFEYIARGQELPRTRQIEAEATYSLWRDEQDYLIAWDSDAPSIRRFVDATGDPYLGASTYLDGQKIRIIAAEERPDLSIVNRTPGKVISVEQACPLVVCGKGILRLTEVVDAATGASVLPFPRFRVRLNSHPAKG
jgi:methionyl-tRNA formyltransferase